MPTPTKGRRMGGSAAHQQHMLANLATALFEHGKIMTTEARARRLRPVAERLITFAKRGDLHARRQVLTVVTDKTVVKTLFDQIGPSYASRQGGYTRITKVGPRKGDNAPMAVIELITSETVTAEADRARRVASSRQATQQPAESSPEAAETADATSEAEAAAGEPATGEAEATEVEESASTEEAPYGEGSHAPLSDGGQPDGFPVKGNEDSKLYHVPGSSHYDRTVAEVWFASAEAAEAAGFELPPAQREKADEGDDS